MAPEVRLELIWVIEQHATLAARGHLVAPSRALRSEGDRGAREGAHAASVPEVTAWEGRDPGFVALTRPVRDEVHEAAVFQLHVQEEVEEAERPLPQTRQAGRGPDVGQEDEGA